MEEKGFANLRYQSSGSLVIIECVQPVKWKVRHNKETLNLVLRNYFKIFKHYILYKRDSRFRVSRTTTKDE